MKLFKRKDNRFIDGEADIEMRPDQLFILGVYCQNKHHIAAIKMTPFVRISFKAQCKICGKTCEGNDIELKDKTTGDEFYNKIKHK